MWYGDKREAKVKICYALQEKGWKIYGYSPDQSDSMTDYYHPASWDGIATKNGYVLLIDIGRYHMSYSGKEIREYDRSNMNKAQVSNARINKLTAMMNDAASTENEKASCKVLIEKELEKACAKPEYIVTDVYPTFQHTNPRGTSWHIEKDGQIIAKGKGVFSTNTYDWENKEKNAAEQKAEKVIAFINKIESILKDSDALESEVIKVPVKVKKEIEKDVSVITEQDIEEGFTFKMKVDYTHGNYKGTKYQFSSKHDGVNASWITFAKLGKTGKPSKARGNGWSMDIAKLNTMLTKGHIAIIEMVEVTEYQEKTVFKKTARKQKANYDMPAIAGDTQVTETETEQKSENNSTNTTEREPATKKQLWALHCATKLDTRELNIDKEKASELIGRSKNGESILEEVKSLLGLISKANPQQPEQTEEEAKYVAGSILDQSTKVIEEMGTYLFNMDKEQLQEYTAKINELVIQNEYNITEKVLNHLRSEGFEQLVDILQEVRVSSEGKRSGSPNTENNHSKLISKIEKQIESAQKRLKAISGDYLTNTWKRQQEEASREKTHEQLREEIALLEYLKDKAAENTISSFELALLTGSIREDMRNYYKRKYEGRQELEYPVIDNRYDLNGWYNQAVPKRQKRLVKAGIYNTTQLLVAVEQFKLITETIYKPKDLKQTQIKNLELKVKLMELEGYFPTPKNIVSRMVDLAEIGNGHRILEPSAGNGNILDGIKSNLDSNRITADIEAIEQSYSLIEILELKGYSLAGNDFLEYGRYNSYDRIIMNPPFEKSADIDHVKHAYKCLKNGGRIVAIMSPHWTFAQNSKATEFRDWLSTVGYYEKLPEGSFKESGTNVNTVLVVIDKNETTVEHAV